VPFAILPDFTSIREPEVIATDRHVVGESLINDRHTRLCCLIFVRIKRELPIKVCEEECRNDNRIPDQHHLIVGTSPEYAAREVCGVLVATQ